MKNRLSKLVDVKSIVTLLLTGVFAYLGILGRITPDQFLTIFTVIIGFYYGTQYQKNADRKEREDDE